MNVASTFRMLAGGLTASLLIGAFGTSAAEARPTKPGGVPGLAGVATWHSGTTYDVAATWGSVAGATSYRAVIVKGSTTLASKNVTGLSWDPTITSGPGPVTLQVQAIVNHRKGTPSKVTVDLPDKVAPTGAFSTSKVDATKVGTITQTALNDDSGTAGITRTVDWGDGTSAVNWASGTTIDHAFAAIGRYVPTVILSDVAGNSVQYTLDAIVLGDVTAPTGSVAVSPSTAWTSFTHVVATPSALSDDVSPQGMIRVHVVWGDGTTSDSTGTAALDHVYAAAGAYDVATTITDESGNPTDLPSSSVTVSDDTVGPKLTLALPAKKHSVKAWKTLRGKATDAPGTGVKKVSLRAVEKRGTAWYGYRPASKTWVKAATKARAYRKGRAFSLTTDAQHRWAASLAGLRKGTLCYKVSATDRVGNVSATRAHKASLTKP
jgi:hypothetical protein